MNDASLNRLLAELDAELDRRTDGRRTAHAVLEHIDQQIPGSVLRCAAGIELRRLGCTSHQTWE